MNYLSENTKKPVTNHIELKEREWEIVSMDSIDDYVLNLHLCTGIFAYPEYDEGRGLSFSFYKLPLLIVHSGPTQGCDVTPGMTMKNVVNAKEFRNNDDKNKLISLNNIFERYKEKVWEKYKTEQLTHHIGDKNEFAQDLEKYKEDPVIVAYVLSGDRVLGNATDLAITRFFLTSQIFSTGKFKLGGASLNDATKVVLNPREALITKFKINDYENSSPLKNFEMGKTYNTEGI